MRPPPPSSSPSLGGCTEATALKGSNAWKFTWEAQSHASVIRLLVFNSDIFRHADIRDLEVRLLPEQSVLVTSFMEKVSEGLTQLPVPIPRVLIDPDSPPYLNAFDDHIEVKLALLLPVDHPLVSEFDSILNLEEERKEQFRPTVDSDFKKLSCMKEVYFYCRHCSSKLTNGLRCFYEMPSANWRDVADNWFGNCCCSFGGVSEKLVASYAKSYMCAPGVGLLSASSVLLCKSDILGCELHDVKVKQNNASGNLSGEDNCTRRCSKDGNDSEEIASPDRVSKSSYSGNNYAAYRESESLEYVLDGDSLLCTPSTKAIYGREAVMNGKRDAGCCDGAHCDPELVETMSNLQINGADDELLENQRVFLDGYLGDGFMIKSSAISKEIQWSECLCSQCSSLIGAYPCIDEKTPIDGGVRLFKCNISTCLPYGESEDAFRNYNLERAFASQLLESSQDELSYRTIVRDIKTKSPVLYIVLLNPNSWGCSGNLDLVGAGSKLVLNPTIKVLYTATGNDTEFDSRMVKDWLKKDEADEIYMFSSQICELVQCLKKGNCGYPSSCAFLQDLLLSSMPQ